MNIEERKWDKIERIRNRIKNKPSPTDVPIFSPSRFERGSLRYILLLRLQEHPLHGYALMKEIEEKYGYSLSPGVVYPTLQMLEDEGLVEILDENHKKVYNLTEEGKRYIQEDTALFEKIKEQLEKPQWNSLPRITEKFRNMAHTIFPNYRYLDEEKQAKIEEVLEDARRRIGQIIYESRGETH
jgi:DNA-binding PadR family transcriptional regulator